MFNMQKIGRKIAALRKEKNMTQMELADKLGISFQAVSNWERGNSMPDIAKLPELAEIFGVSLDGLLGEKSVLVEAAIADTLEECIVNQSVSPEEVGAVLPILKPNQVNTIIENADKFDWNGIQKFLPYMGEDDVRELACKALEQGGKIRGFLPYMYEDDVKEFALDALKKGEKIDEFLPFMDEDDVKELASAALEKGEQVDKYLPFMDEDDVKEFALTALEKGEQIDKYLPFMDEGDVKELALRVLKGKL